MNKEIKLPNNYRCLTENEIETLEGGVGYKELFDFLVRIIGETAVAELVKYAGEKTYSALLNAAKKMQNPAYQAWVREFNRHQYCCQGNGIGKGCPGRG